MFVGGWAGWMGRTYWSGAIMGSVLSVYGGGASSNEWRECDDDAGRPAWWRRPIFSDFSREKESKYSKWRISKY